LVVRRDLDYRRGQALERAALLALALDSHAGPSLKGSAAWPAAWARSGAGKGIAVVDR